MDDDYIKFIRLAQEMVQRNGSGIVGLITNNSFLDGVTHRKMRLDLLGAFDEIYILNLHGDVKLKEVAPDGTPDQNVFDIMQGVSISLFVKRSNSNDLAIVRYADLWGSRTKKTELLWNVQFSKQDENVLSPIPPYYFFVPKDFAASAQNDRNFDLTDFFQFRGIGAKTERDRLSVHFTKSGIEQVLLDFQGADETMLRAKYSLQNDSRDWTLRGAISDVAKTSSSAKFERIAYKPFDIRQTYYTGTSRGFMGTPGRKLSEHLLRENISLIVNKKFVGDKYSHVSIVNTLASHGIHYLGNRGQDYCFPLYLYPTETELDQTRRVNFDEKIYAKIRAAAKHGTHGEPDEVAVFDYIYGVLHCPAYRETFKEFLKIDFPRVPYPPSPEIFWDVSAKGTQLRRLHLMEPEIIGDTPYPFKGEGDNIVEKPARDAAGRVHINKTQYFENVPELAWEFYIGGYQPAQKWLKDRKTRELSFNDIIHYQRIIKILIETDRIMKTIEMPLGA